MKFATHVAAFIAAAAIAASTGCAQHEPKPSGSRPGTWAKPLFMPGLDNFYRVSESLYRGAQPGPEGFRKLHGMGIRTVINLRSMHSDADEIGGLPLRMVDIGCEAHDPDEDEVVEFLKAVTDSANHPVFVHCKHGSDRTGLMCAVYRVAVQGWEKEQAIEELTLGGFGFHKIYTDIPKFLRNMDVGKIMARAGLK